MSDAVAAVQTTAPAQATSPKKQKSAAAKKPRVKPAHPRTSEMVLAAVKNLKERSGSSLQAIKKYIAANYKVDAEKLAPFIKKYLKIAVTDGSLVQTKGKGASGSFKLAAAEKPEKKPKTVSAVAIKKKTTKKSPAKPAKPAAKKLTTKKTAAAASPAKAKKAPAAAAKKAAAAKVKTPVKAKVAAAAAKSPSKAKKTTKGAATKKPKTPKPKKTAVKKVAPKKK